MDIIVIQRIYCGWYESEVKPTKQFLQPRILQENLKANMGTNVPFNVI